MFSIIADKQTTQANKQTDVNCNITDQHYNVWLFLNDCWTMLT